MRKDRNLNQLRNIEFIGNFSQYAEGSCLVKFGNTHVLCTASLDQSVPRWLKGFHRPVKGGPKHSEGSQRETKVGPKASQGAHCCA